MKSYRKEVSLNISTRRGFLNITPEIAECVRESGINEGLVLVNSMHTTSSVCIDDDEEGMLKLFEPWLEKLAPVLQAGDYSDEVIGEDIVDAHMKRQIMGREVTVAITNGKLDLGQWEQIIYGEFDGGRTKRVLVKIIGD
jgi:secondary thiamine-phosphate synthase enzyme